MSKRVHGNKEAKKPKQAARLLPPPAGGPNAPVQPAVPKPHPGRR